MEKIVLTDSKTDLISRFKKEFPYTYAGKIKEFMESELKNKSNENKSTEKI